MGHNTLKQTADVIAVPSNTLLISELRRISRGVKEGVEGLGLFTVFFEASHIPMGRALYAKKNLTLFCEFSRLLAPKSAFVSKCGQRKPRATAPIRSKTR